MSKKKILDFPPNQMCGLLNGFKLSLSWESLTFSVPFSPMSWGLGIKLLGGRGWKVGLINSIGAKTFRKSNLTPPPPP